MQLLLDVENIDNTNQVSCSKSLQEYLAIFFGENYSLTYSSSCSKCELLAIKESHSIKADGIETIISDEYLEILVNESCKIFVCNLCKSLMRTSLGIRNYLIVDVQDSDLSINILKLKNDLVVNKEIFDIAGVITYSVNKGNGLKEYQGFYKLSCKTWYYQNFYEKKERKVGKNYKEISQVALIMYVPRSDRICTAEFNPISSSA